MEAKYDSRKEQLQVLFNELNSAIGLREKKYFHYNTIENLIFHFDEVKGENDQNWVYATLEEYLRKCFGLLPSIDRETSKGLFYEYVTKLTTYYQDNLGFTMLLNRSLVYLVYFVILGICYTFFNWYVLIVVASFFIFQIVRVFMKYRAKRVYGIYW